jgi:hypothetical protein
MQEEVSLFSLFGRMIMMKVELVSGPAFCKEEECFVHLSDIVLDFDIDTGKIVK